MTADDEITMEGRVLDTPGLRRGQGHDSAEDITSGHTGNKAVLCRGRCGLRHTGRSGFHPQLDLTLISIPPVQHPSSFPQQSTRAAVRKHQARGRGALRHQESIVSQFWGCKPEVKMSGGLVPSEASRWPSARAHGVLPTCPPVPKGALWVSTRVTSVRAHGDNLVFPG